MSSTNCPPHVCVCLVKNHQRGVICLNANNYPEPCSEEAARHSLHSNNLAYILTSMKFWVDRVYCVTPLVLIVDNNK